MSFTVLFTKFIYLKTLLIGFLRGGHLGGHRDLLTFLKKLTSVNFRMLLVRIVYFEKMIQRK